MNEKTSIPFSLMYYLPSFYHNICYIKLKNKYIKFNKTHLTMACGPELSSNLRLTLHLKRFTFICMNSELLHLTHIFEVWNFTWYRLWNFTITILLGKTKYLWCLNFASFFNLMLTFEKVFLWTNIRYLLLTLLTPPGKVAREATKLRSSIEVCKPEKNISNFSLKWKL